MSRDILTNQLFEKYGEQLLHEKVTLQLSYDKSEKQELKTKKFWEGSCLKQKGGDK